MVKVAFGEGAFWRVIVPALALGVIIFSAVVIVYGLESMAPGVHDVFHDFRHVVGMPCH
ncbi:MAG: CbtB-domain containing protein [Deltaproteobacteria bacterium]|nr:CbtB-domain containing protein [Deltaproteobacteria bacterium]